MPYANNQGIRIHYQVEGEGPPLVLVHGLNLSLDWWRLMGYVEALKNDYQLVLIDARGHGASDGPHGPESYRMVPRVADVVAVLDDLCIDKAHYLGYSMGGSIGWGIAKYAPERLSSLTIGGSAPYESDPEGARFWLELYRQGMEALLAAGETMFGSRWTPEVKAIGQANDLDALIALVSVEERLGFEDILPTIALPCLVFAGEAAGEYAGARECVKHLPNATFVSLPGLDHIEAIYRINLVLPHITKFLAEVGED